MPEPRSKSKMRQVVMFGEIMMRLTAPGRQRFSQAQSLDVTYGGSEANVAVSLAMFGQDAAFVTRLPENAFGDSAIAALRAFGVDTSHIARGGNRIGIYFVEQGASQRASTVMYDRAGSAIADIGPDQFDWHSILQGAGWFHFSGITPALGAQLQASTLEASRAARNLGVKVSCDLNYRSKLWTLAQARESMTQMMKSTDVLIANEEQAEQVLGIRAEVNQTCSASESLARRLSERFALSIVALTGRESRSADDNMWSATLLHEGCFFSSPTYNIHIVDRIGGGDAFTAGLIYGLSTQMSAQDALNFAVAASCLKHSICGDFNLVSVAEVEQLMHGDGSGRVRR